MSAPAQQKSSTPPVFGSAEFQPGPDHPFGWRGDGSGRFPGATPVTDWAPDRNVRWKTTVGSAYSSPILTRDAVIVTSEPNLLICLDRKDGRVRWQTAIKPDDLSDPGAREKVKAYQPPKDGSGLAAATPVTDGRYIYALLANGLLAAVDLEGTLKWITWIEAAQSTAYGRSASPLLLGERLIVHMTNLYAFDAGNGRQIWVNSEAKSGYGSPASCRLGEMTFILTSLGDLIRASDGKAIRSELGHTAHSSPIAENGLLVFGDSTLTALKLDQSAKNEGSWEAMLPGEVFGSPLLHDGKLYVVTGDGLLSVFDFHQKVPADPLSDPRPVFQESGGSGPAAFASLTLAGQHLFLNSNDGEIVVLEANPEAPLVSRIKLPEGAGASPVFSGSDMYLRDGDKLWCIGK